MPEAEVKDAIHFAEAEEFVDVYCFTYCITGGPMETAFKDAWLQGMDKHAILRWATTPGNPDIRAPTPEEQARHKRVRNAFRLAEQREAAADPPEPPKDAELTEAYRARFKAATEGMSREKVLEYFGVPKLTRIAVLRHLNPTRGMAIATADETARRKAAYRVALERFDALS